MRALPTICVAIFGLLCASADRTNARARGHFAHHSQVKVWHGSRIGGWHHGRHWPNKWTHSPGWRGRPPVYALPSWKFGNGYRWQAWHWRRHARLASNDHHRSQHTNLHWLSHSSYAQRGRPERQGAWHISPGFGTAGHRGPVRQGEWQASPGFGTTGHRGPVRQGEWQASPGFGTTGHRGPVRQGEWRTD